MVNTTASQEQNLLKALVYDQTINGPSSLHQGSWMLCFLSHLGHVSVLHLILVQFDLLVVLPPHLSQGLGQLELVLHSPARVHLHQTSLVSTPCLLDLLQQTGGGGGGLGVIVVTCLPCCGFLHSSEGETLFKGSTSYSVWELGQKSPYTKNSLR